MKRRSEDEASELFLPPGKKNMSELFPLTDDEEQNRVQSAGCCTDVSFMLSCQRRVHVSVQQRVPPHLLLHSHCETQDSTSVMRSLTDAEHRNTAYQREHLSWCLLSVMMMMMMMNRCL